MSQPRWRRLEPGVYVLHRLGQGLLAEVRRWGKPGARDAAKSGWHCVVWCLPDCIYSRWLHRGRLLDAKARVVSQIKERTDAVRLPEAVGPNTGDTKGAE